VRVLMLVGFEASAHASALARPRLEGVVQDSMVLLQQSRERLIIR
jgi:hypothetical protein